MSDSPHRHFVPKHTYTKRENFLVPLCRTPTPWRSQTISLVLFKAVVFICTRRRLPSPSWILGFRVICPLHMGVYRCERLSIRRPVWAYWAAIHTLRHIDHISPTRSMAAPNDEYNSANFDHESMDVGRDEQSVKFLTFMWSSLADHPVPLVPTSIISERPSAHVPKRYS